MKLKNYWEPTPKFARAVGDALLSVGTVITAYNISTDDKTIALTCLVSMVFGKFITNFFADDGPKTDQ